MSFRLDDIDRKILSDIAISDSSTFEKIIKKAVK